MANDQLLVYINQCRSHNIPDAQILHDLLALGWPKESVQAAFAQLSSSIASQNPQTPDTQLLNDSKNKIYGVVLNQTDSSHHINLPKLLGIVLLFLICTLTLAGTLFYFFVIDTPQQRLNKSIQEFKKSGSFTATLTLGESAKSGNFSATIDFHKNQDQLSSVQVNLAQINADPSETVNVSLLGNKHELFLKGSYSKLDKLENQLNLTFPDLKKLQIYQMIKQILKENYWLHIDLSELNKIAQTGKKSQIQINQDQTKELEKKLLKSITYRSYDRNFLLSGNFYYRIKIGLNKEALLQVLDYIKSLNIDVKLSDINEVESIIKSVDSWDQDLIEVLLDKSGSNLYQISLSLPQIRQDLLKAKIEEKLSQEKSVGIFKNLFTNATTKLFPSENKDKLYKIGKIIFSNYNKAPIVQRPEQTIEFKTLADLFEKEVLPLILAMMQQQFSSLQKMNNLNLKNQINNPNVLLPSIKTTVAPSNSSNFQSNGDVTIEPNIKARMLSASLSGNTLVTQFIFSNTGSSQITVLVGRISLRDATLGTANKQNVFSLPLAPGASRQQELIYDLLPSSPYRWVYSSPNGPLYELGRFIR